MINGFTLGHILFKILNFALLIGIAGYFGKKKLYAQLLERMAHKKRMALVQDVRLQELAVQRESIRNIIVQDALFFQRMKGQLVIWNQAVDRMYVLKQQEQRVFGRAADERQQVRQKNINIIALRRSVLPKALRDAARILEEQFDDEVKGCRYLNAIVAHMQRDK